MNTIFAKLLYLIEKNIDTMLVTIVSHQGSAPRGTGSQMLVEPHGRVLGTIGGGPGEKEAEALALAWLKEKRSGLHEYILRKNDQEDIGSVCGGDMTVYFQYIPADSTLWKELAGKLCDAIASKTQAWFIQRLDTGVPALITREETLCGEAPQDAARLCGDGSMLLGNCFSMHLPIGERAVIFGAGHCALALSPILSSVGFRVTVFDNRREYARSECFPEAESVICGDFDHISDHLQLTDDDYVVIMSSGHSHDLSIEKQVLLRPLAYVGVIGSRSKTAAVNARLREAGVPEEAILSVHTPIGMNIKAVTPAEIAVSIAGEMILVRADRRQQAGVFTKSCPMH